MVINMIVFTSLQKSLWVDAFKIIVYLLNKVTSKAVIKTSLGIYMFEIVQLRLDLIDLTKENLTQVQ